jgi:hypothetical protein
MGGWGSGRKAGRDLTSDFLCLDVRHWQRRGYLKPGMAFSWQWSRRGEKIASISVRYAVDRVILSYRSRDRGAADWESLEYPVAIEWTPCHFGGRRAWFLCPGRGCGRRVAILYGGRVYACRHCYQLAYECQRERPLYRALNRAQDIRVKLGGSGSMDESYPPRPKGMHRRTYRRWVRKSESVEGRLWALEAAMLGIG